MQRSKGGVVTMIDWSNEKPFYIKFESGMHTHTRARAHAHVSG